MAKKATTAEARGDHHPSLPEHRTMDEAIRAVPVVLNVFKGQAAEFAHAAQAVAVVVDYGSQFFHAGFSSTEAPALSQDEAVAHLEAFASQGRATTESAAAIPWQVIVPIVLELFMKWWKDRK